MIEGPLTAAFVTSAAAVLKPKACVHDFLCLMFRDELQSMSARNSGAFLQFTNGTNQNAIADSISYAQPQFQSHTQSTPLPLR
jgi:hypothetical protein